MTQLEFDMNKIAWSTKLAASILCFMAGSLLTAILIINSRVERIHKLLQERLPAATETTDGHQDNP